MKMATKAAEQETPAKSSGAANPVIPDDSQPSSSSRYLDMLAFTRKKATKQGEQRAATSSGVISDDSQPSLSSRYLTSVPASRDAPRDETDHRYFEFN
jgi:hypothetical protein